MAPEHDSTWSSGTLNVGARSYRIRRLGAVAEAGLGDPARPHSIRVLLENLLRCEDSISRERDLRLNNQDDGALCLLERSQEGSRKERADLASRMPVPVGPSANAHPDVLPPW